MTLSERIEYLAERQKETGAYTATVTFAILESWAKEAKQLEIDEQRKLAAQFMASFLANPRMADVGDVSMLMTNAVQAAILFIEEMNKFKADGSK